MKKILIVDDASDTRTTLKALLKKQDVEILEAADGVEGWDIIVKDHPDLILLDLHMPQKDGFSILEDLEEEWMGIPVVIVSGDTDEETISTCNFFGAKAYLKKPIVLEDFKEVIKVIEEETKEKGDL
ncbi:response regulator [Carboxylicivirga linearis]|uniref:Response regulator n=1 Tax=Carboxylicivirga linearis TaxID=1628157 RepID=A0ABS5JTD3_9BACT|nr:response regulator [Carboxylicivirga linearis]MBS2098128.1 response regulator [Carboxylicivirga linearis]